jgi:hypothetical protein
MKLIYLKESKLCWRILFILVPPFYLAMLDIAVGLIGVVLIIYLLATVIRPELF